MKKLYRKGAVHPSPPITPDHLSFLPATIFALAAALSPDDREVLAYLIYRSDANILTEFSSTYRHPAGRNVMKSGRGGSGCGGDRDHPPHFSCDCFRCYMSYWVRWDSSPNRQLIHEIIDAFEESLAESKRPGKGRREKKRRGVADESKRPELGLEKGESGKLDSVDDSNSIGGGGSGDGGGENIEDGGEKGSVGRFVSFIGERLWGTVWG